MAEHSAVNRRVVGSSPTCGAISSSPAAANFQKVDSTNLRGIMSSPYESADLILKLYDLRREEVMRAARQWYIREFHPQNAQDVVNVLRGNHSAYFRMVTSYWEMAASFVNNGAIDWKMFMDANPGEPINVFVKLYPCLEELRSMFASEYDDSQAFQNLEQVVMKLPNAKEQIAERVEQFSEARARWQLEKEKLESAI